MRRYFLLAIISLVLLLTVALAAYAEEPTFIVSNVKATPIQAKGVSKVTLTVLYSGSYYLRDVYFRLIPCVENPDVKVVSDNPIYRGWIAPSQTLILEYLVKANRPIKCKGALIVKWSSKYTRIRTLTGVVYVRSSGSGKQTSYFELSIRGLPNIAIYVTPNRLKWGVPNEVVITVENNGSGTIYGLTLTITATRAFISPYRTFNLGALAPDEAKSIRISITPISTILPLVISYSGFGEDGSYVRGSVTETLTVLKPNPMGLIAYAINAHVVPGHNDVRVCLKNDNPIGLNNVTLYISRVTGAVLLENATYSLGTLGPHSTKCVIVSIYVPRESRFVELGGITTFGIGPETMTSSISLSLSVIVTPLLKVVNYQISPSNISVGKALSIAITLSNIGYSTAYNLNVTVIPGRGLEVIRSRSLYLGSLAPQQLASAVFSLMAVKSGNTTVSFLIQYNDDYGRKYSEIYEIPIYISKPAIVNKTQTRGFTFRLKPFSATPQLAVLMAFAVAISITCIFIGIYMTKRRVSR